jgi:hypothetical protein
MAPPQVLPSKGQRVIGSAVVNYLCKGIKYGETLKSARGNRTFDCGGLSLLI